MLHSKKAASKTPMDAYFDGCRHLDIDRISDQDIQEIVLTTNLTPGKCLEFKTPFQALVAELAKRRSNPLLLSALRFAPESRTRSGKARSAPRRRLR
jgi:hypothetical protein